MQAGNREKTPCPYMSPNTQRQPPFDLAVRSYSHPVSHCFIYSTAQDPPHAISFKQEVTGYGPGKDGLDLTPPRASLFRHHASALPAPTHLLFHRDLAVSHPRDLLQTLICLQGTGSHSARATPFPSSAQLSPLRWQVPGIGNLTHKQ